MTKTYSKNELMDVYVEGFMEGWGISNEGHNSEYGGPPEKKLREMAKRIFKFNHEEEQPND